MGGFVSTTVTLVVQLLAFFAVSAALQVTAVVPSGKLVPEAGQLTTAASQLSRAVAANEAGALPPPEHSTVIGAGHVTVGGSVSSTVTVPVHVENSPLLSVTVSVTIVVPAPNGPAGDWLSVIVSPGSGLNEPLLMDAGAVHTPAVLDIVTFVRSATGGVFVGAHTTLAVLPEWALRPSLKAATSESVPAPPRSGYVKPVRPSASVRLPPLTLPIFGPEITPKSTETPVRGIPFASTTVAVSPTRLPATILWDTGLSAMPEPGSAHANPSGFQSCTSIRSNSCRKCALRPSGRQKFSPS